MQTVILFDLFDTLLSEVVSFHVPTVIRHLYETRFAGACTWEAFHAFSETFLRLYEKRKEDNSEVCFIFDEVKPCFEHFGVPAPSSWEDLDYELIQEMLVTALPEDVPGTLSALKERGAELYVLSNTILTGSSMRRLLNGYGILPYFNKVYASSDYGVRKPDKRFFDVALDEILPSFPGLRREEVFYVGNDYHFDVHGALNAGIRPVWLNRGCLPDEEGLGIASVERFDKLLQIV